MGYYQGYMAEDQDLRYQTISRIAQVTRQLTWLGSKRFAQLLTDYHLTAPQYYVMASLSRQDHACSMQVLADITHQDAATVTGIVDRLVKLGYVSRQRGEDDRRKVYVTLEETGREIVDQVREVTHESWQHTFSALNQDELNEMLRMMSAVLLAWEAIPETTDGKKKG
jgi:DNA-binding MarR family transcriptional regulator